VGVSHAVENAAPVPSTVTTVAQETNDDANDNTGLWGLAGLLGLLGLAGLKRRNDTRATPTTRAANPEATNPGF
jgi:LPXTG-motif cell wall-anchored protein